MTEKLSQFLSAPTAPALTDGVPASTYAGTPDSTKNYQWSLEQIGESLAAGGLTRTILTGNLNLYVNASTGSDSYNGLSATFTGGVNGPKATPQAAVNVAYFGYDFAYLYSLTISVADGTYDVTSSIAGLYLPALFGIGIFNPPTIQGNTATPDNCILTSSNDVIDVYDGNWIVQGFQLATSNTSADNLYVNNNTVISIDAIDFAGTPQSHAYASQYGLVFMGGVTNNITISASTTQACFGTESGTFSGDNVTFTFANNPNFSPFINVDGTSAGFFASGITLVNANTVTGRKFIAYAGDILLNSTGGNIDRSQCPGSTTGLLQNGGQWFADLPYSVDAPTTGGTVTMAPGQAKEILNPSGTLATLTVQLPTNMCDGETIAISTTQDITALTIAATDGSTVVGAATSLVAGQIFSMLFDANVGSPGTWYP